MKSKKFMVAFLAATLCVTPTIYASTETYLNYTSETTESVRIVDEQGWLESAFVTWQPVTDASGYTVYYKAVGESDSAYKQLDDELIRKYPSYFRADTIGLPEGDYVMKVVPLFEGVEDFNKQAITSTITVTPHTREGFAFSKESPMGTGSGGYNDDGSIPTNAQIVYITADNVNTVQLGVITDSKGTVTTATGLVNILAARQKGHDRRPLIIRLVGTVKASDIQGLNSSGYIQIKGSYNTTFEGVGEDATVNGWGILVRESHNVEIRNLGIMLFPDDGISLDTKNENIWVHNNDIFYGTAGGDADQAKGDGAADVKGFSNYITISYNHFWDAGKSSLCGMTESQEFFVTYHHNWYDHSDSRHPRIRKGTIHIYNNYFDGNSKYGVGMTTGGSAFVEANDFRNCKYPMLISLQGTDIADGNVGTFSKEPGGMIKAYNNKIEGAARLIYQTEDNVHFDAYLATSRDEQISDSYKSVAGEHTYNNFDTNEKMYDYAPDAPENVKYKVTTYAGRVNGGDLKWKFTADDDTDYSVNVALMSAIRNYQSDLISIGGNSPSEPVEPGNPDTGNPDIPQGDVVHNFTESGKESNFFTINGNLSTSKGNVSYNGMNLTQCLKLESSTNVQFTTTKSATLTMVLDSGFSGNVVVDGVKRAATDGILTLEIEPGEHTITKGDTANLFYISLDMLEDENNEDSVADQEEASKVDVLIEALPENITLDNKEAVMDAKVAYQNLTIAQKALVKQENVIKLQHAEKTIEELETGLETETIGTVLISEDEVKEGEIVEIILGINNLKNPVYAGDMVITYDSDKLILDKVTVFEPVMLAGRQEEKGSIRLLLGNQEGIVDASNLLKLSFTAKDTEEDVEANVKVGSGLFGIVVDGNGQSVESNLTNKTIIIKDVPVAPPGEVEDVNKDKVIDVADLAIVAYYYRATVTSDNWKEAKKADVTGDGVVDIDDLIMIANKILEQ